MSAWYTERQLEYFRNGVRGVHKDDQFGSQMTPFANILPGPEAVRDVAGYIQHMKPAPAEPTVKGNAEQGKRLYRTCASCHGHDGEGRRSTNAPRLAGVNDWYHMRQLRNFKDGVRGAHPDDMYGPQMRAMSRIMTDEDALRHVVTYINTLTGYDDEDSRTMPELAGRND
jgi:cytochrome c oxidase subunit 2